MKLELGPEKAMCGSAGHSQRAQRNMCILPFTTTMLCHSTTTTTPSVHSPHLVNKCHARGLPGLVSEL